MLIGLTGAPGAGKSTVGEMLRSIGWRDIAFADALRVEVSAAFGIDMQLLQRRELKERETQVLAVGNANNANFLRWCAVQGLSLIAPRSPRWCMQQWGTFRRDGNAAHWINHVTYWIHYQRGRHHAKLVVTDVRMPNEAAALRALGGRIVRVHRPETPALATDTAAHESERHGQLPADADIHNDSTITALMAEVQRVLALLAAQPATTTNRENTA